MSQKGLRLTNGVWENYDITTSNDVGYNDFIINAKLEKVVDNVPERSVFKTTDDISSSAYEGAYDNVIPYWITQKDKDDEKAFIIPESEPFTYSTINEFGYDYPTYPLPKAIDDITKKEEPSKFITKLGEFGTAIKEKTKSFFDKPIPFFPGVTFTQALTRATRPNANQSYRGIGGLYSKEISLMNTYGSTMPTAMNPTGDPRKDDDGFNIVSFAGNYNMLGTYSRRHNMLKAADIYEKNSKEWKNTRNKIRSDWKEEKDTGIVNNNYDIDSSGSHDKDKIPPKQNGDRQTKVTSKTKAVVARSAPSPYREGGGEHGGMTRGDQSRDPTGGSPF